MCERGVFRHDLFDGTTEYHVCDSQGPIVVAHVASRVPQEFVEGRLTGLLNAFEPDGTTSTAAPDSLPLRLFREAVA